MPEGDPGGFPYGKHLRLLRRIRDMTQEDLADSAAVSVQTVARIERGIDDPRFSTCCSCSRPSTSPSMTSKILPPSPRSSIPPHALKVKDL